MAIECKCIQKVRMKQVQIRGRGERSTMIYEEQARHIDRFMKQIGIERAAGFTKPGLAAVSRKDTAVLLYILKTKM